MCPTGLCFTPRVDTKKSIDLFVETQGPQALGIEIDLDKKTYCQPPKPSALIRLSPVSYFYSKHSSSKSLEILKDWVKRMFGKNTSIDIFFAYIELVVNTLKVFQTKILLNQSN
ncbi:unnamed protein product [Rotaria sp. Silwood2]|nr:unnamed protein product [Rotaria sp. Silwood2]CAF4558617.1 unnamed protein product [Rotaria sp. Silwood2]